MVDQDQGLIVRCFSTNPAGDRPVPVLSRKLYAIYLLLWLAGFRDQIAQWEVVFLPIRICV